MGELLGDGGFSPFRWRSFDLFYPFYGEVMVGVFFSAEKMSLILSSLLFLVRFSPISVFCCLFALLLTRHDRDVYVTLDSLLKIFCPFFFFLSSRIKCAPSLRMTDVRMGWKWDGMGMGWNGVPVS